MSTIPSLNLTSEQLSTLLAENPCLEGMCKGYAMELHVKEQLLQDSLVNSVIKARDHDRNTRYDFLVDHALGETRVEVKMLRQKDMVRMSKSYGSYTHIDEDGTEIKTFDLLRDNFDVLAVANPATGTAVFIRQEDIPYSEAKSVPEDKRHLFCKTSFPLDSVTRFNSLEELLVAEPSDESKAGGVGLMVSVEHLIEQALSSSHAEGLV